MLKSELTFSVVCFALLISCKPEICLSQTKTTPRPIEVYDSMWQIMNDNYAFFKLRGVDWSHQNSKFRKQALAINNNQQLFSLLCEMIDPLDDGHTSLITENRKFNSAPFEKWYEKRDSYQRTIADRYIRNVQEVASGQLLFGMVQDSIGYINIRSSEGYNYNLIDTVLEKLLPCKAMIIDIRFNHGGEDIHSIGIVNRFADKKRFAYSKQTYYKGAYTKLLEIFCEPMGKKQFTGPIAVLTSKMTCSAAEMFTMGIGVFPYVTIIGERTQGMHSDILQKKLPNGWTLNLSNQIYYWTDGKVYEKIGLPPDIEIHFDPSAFDKGKDQILEAAVDYLRRK